MIKGIKVKRRVNGCGGWIHNVCILLDEIEGGVSVGQEGGKSTFKDKITCVITRM